MLYEEGGGVAGGAREADVTRVSTVCTGNQQTLSSSGMGKVFSTIFSICHLFNTHTHTFLRAVSLDMLVVED